MKNALFFEIPDDAEIRAKLVEVVPSSWLWVNGELHAPEVLVTSGRVAEHTGYSLSRSHRAEPTIIGGYDGNGGGRKTADLFAIMVEQKLPSFISFDQAGYSCRPISMDLAKRIAMAFLRRGYCGRLDFIMSCHDDGMHENAARCEMRFGPWHGPPVFEEEAGPQPARARLEWESRYGGEESHVAAIADACRSLKLREYIPGVPTAAALQTR